MIRNQRRRVSLQTLQITADEDLLTGEMVHQKEEVKAKEIKQIEKIVATEKENIRASRTARQKTKKSTSKEEPKPVVLKKLKAEPKKVATKSKTKTDKVVADLKQPKINSVLSSASLKSTAIDNDTANGKPEESPAVQENIAETTVFQPDCSTSTTNDSTITLLTGSTAPESYWRDLAEQRRIALDETLHENELLQDQLAVLEAENSQLKSLLKEAEQLASIVKGMID
ncbi:uncharacterized protein LOC118182041 [Stegodyphus dumicola]|uniref:uncharacterized protein LOC118182041 n=1 Tax=Stegodyphus dumicola TaxID=202533 RepID=UPI0015B1A155|nr:uncharacterized protein LOC118182041 [Stegodyphus dumicola]